MVGIQHTNAMGMNGKMAQNNGNVYRMKDAQQGPQEQQMGSDSFSRFVIVLFPAIECLHLGVIRRSQRLFQHFFNRREYRSARLRFSKQLYAHFGEAYATGSSESEGCQCPAFGNMP